jgi:hypothetical protein
VRILTQVALRIFFVSFWLSVVAGSMTPVCGWLMDISKVLAVVAAIDLFVSASFYLSRAAERRDEALAAGSRRLLERSPMLTVELSAMPSIEALLIDHDDARLRRAEDERIRAIRGFHYHDAGMAVRVVEGVRFVEGAITAYEDGDCPRCPEEGPWAVPGQFFGVSMADAEEGLRLAMRRMNGG